ncbi:MAG: 2-oxoacid:ferredoxin oxidoreductase subunit delta [Bacillales bacterium]|jgi:2-oxoglutarate ferredoxin oxidoreductase subunit delta|nr:2-oxoacid:ferredoxin oxidoreductase subunit delta [Bacillales bacterium]
MEERVIFSKDYCKSCGLCVRVCPTNVIFIGKDLNTLGYRAATVENQDGCISCGKCAQICPDLVISVYRPERKVATN